MHMKSIPDGILNLMSYAWYTIVDTFQFKIYGQIISMVSSQTYLALKKCHLMCMKSILITHISIIDTKRNSKFNVLYMIHYCRYLSIENIRSNNFHGWDSDVCIANLSAGWWTTRTTNCCWLHWENYISIFFHIKWDMIVVTVILSIFWTK